MKKSLLILCCMLSGCAMTPQQKKVTVAVTTVVATGLLMTHGKTRPTVQAVLPPGNPPFVGPLCYIQKNGTCR